MAENKEYKFAPITDLNLKQMGVQALADRPNAAQQYGQSGLSPTELKRWFDKLATLLSRKVNELQEAINGEDASKYIGVAIGEYKTLYDLLEGMQDGTFAEDVLKLWPNENAPEKATLQDIIYGVAQSVSEIEEELERLDDDKLSKVTDAAVHKRVYAVDDKGAQTILDAAASPSGQVPLYSENGALIAKMTYNPATGFKDYSHQSEAVTMAFMNEFINHIGAGVEIVVNPNDYTFYVNIYNRYGQWIGKSNTVDLPLEGVVTSGTYDNGNIIFTLNNGETIVIPVATMVNGLVTQSRHETDIKDLNSKVDALFKGYIEDVYALVGGDYVDYS